MRDHSGHVGDRLMTLDVRFECRTGLLRNPDVADELFFGAGDVDDSEYQPESISDEACTTQVCILGTADRERDQQRFIPEAQQRCCQRQRIHATGLQDYRAQVTAHHRYECCF